MNDKTFAHEKQSSRAYLLPMANRHAAEHMDMAPDAALADFVKDLPNMPKDERDWLCDQYKRVFDLYTAKTQEMKPHEPQGA